MAASLIAPDDLEPIDGDEARELELWSGFEIRGGEFTGERFERFRVTNTALIGCELSGVNLAEAELWRVELRDCRMSGVIFEAAHLRDVRMVGCKLDAASMRASRAERIELDDCVLREVDFTGATWSDAALTGCDLTGANVSAVRWSGARLHGSTLDGLIDPTALRGVVVDPGQALPLGLQLLDALAIAVDHGDRDADQSSE